MPLPVIDVAQMREWQSAKWLCRKTGLQSSRLQKVQVCQASPGNLQRRRFDTRAGWQRTQWGRCTCGNQTFAPQECNPSEHHGSSKVTVDLRKKLSAKPQLVVDALFGIGLNRPLKAPWCEVIDLVNAANLNVVAIDIPSGLNGLDGKPEPVAIKASLTLTVGAPKKGLLESTAWPYVGRLEVLENIRAGSLPFRRRINLVVPRNSMSFHPGAKRRHIKALMDILPSWLEALAITGLQCSQQGALNELIPA